MIGFHRGALDIGHHPGAPAERQHRQDGEQPEQLEENRRHALRLHHAIPRLIGIITART